KIEFVIHKIRPWKAYLQTIGIAIPNERLFEQKIAKKLGKVGFSSPRVVGSVCIPRLGETWDGNYPIYEYYIPDFIHWESINTANISDEISRLYVQYDKLVTNGVFN
ncbi:MAG: acyl-CoA reductase, partial [Candidatus Heimdallarchaeota archaeon]